MIALPSSFQSGLNLIKQGKITNYRQWAPRSGMLAVILKAPGIHGTRRLLIFRLASFFSWPGSGNQYLNGCGQSLDKLTLTADNKAKLLTFLGKLQNHSNVEQIVAVGAISDVEQAGNYGGLHVFMDAYPNPLDGDAINLLEPNFQYPFHVYLIGFCYGGKSYAVSRVFLDSGEEQWISAYDAHYDLPYVPTYFSTWVDAAKLTLADVKAEADRFYKSQEKVTAPQPTVMTPTPTVTLSPHTTTERGSDVKLLLGSAPDGALTTPGQSIELNRETGQAAPAQIATGGNAIDSNITATQDSVNVGVLPKEKGGVGVDMSGGGSSPQPVELQPGVLPKEQGGTGVQVQPSDTQLPFGFRVSDFISPVKDKPELLQPVDQGLTPDEGSRVKDAQTVATPAFGNLPKLLLIGAAILIVVFIFLGSRK